MYNILHYLKECPETPICSLSMVKITELAFSIMISIIFVMPMSLKSIKVEERG